MAKLRGNWKVRERSDTIESFLRELYNPRSGGDDETLLVDVLADLMHFAYRHRLDFDAALASAYNHAEVERQPRFNEGREV